MNDDLPEIPPEEETPGEETPEENVVLSLTKARLGIASNVRDTYLTAIIDGVIRELEDEKGLALDMANPYHVMFVVDYSTWRYQNRDSEKGMPRNLQFRLHNLMVHIHGGDADDI